MWLHHFWGWYNIIKSSILFLFLLLGSGQLLLSSKLFIDQRFGEIIAVDYYWV